MIKINRSRVIPKGNLVEHLVKIMDRQDAERLVEQLENYQKFQEKMKRMVHVPDKIQIKLENEMDKERFLNIVKKLYFDKGCALKNAIEKAKKQVNLEEKEIDEILQKISNYVA